MVVMATIGQLEYGMPPIEVVANHQASRLKLSQNAVDSRQTDVFTGLHQRLVDVLGAHVALARAVEHLQNLHPGKGYFQTSFTKFVVLNHGWLSRCCCFAASFNTGMIRVLCPAKIVEVTHRCKTPSSC